MHTPGVTAHPTRPWTAQQAHGGIDETFYDNGVRALKTPVRSPGRIHLRSDVRERYGASALTIS